MNDSAWESVRSLFPVLNTWAHLNSAAFGPTPSTAIEAMNDHFVARDEHASLDVQGWFERLDRIRGKIGRLIGADAADIAFCPNAASGLSWLLQGIEWRPGDEVLGLDHEFPNNLYAPLLLDAKGVRFRPLATPHARFDPGLILDAIRPSTRLVVISSVNYSNGLRAPLDALSSELRSQGVLLCVDATQSVGALRLDLREVPADYLIVHGYKWMMAPPGAGFVYVPAETRAWLPPSIVSWRSHRAWRDFECLHHGRPELPSEAAVFEGGVQGFALLFALEACVDLILDCGPEAIERRILGLATECREILRAHGGMTAAKTDEPCESPIVTASFTDRDPVRLQEELKARRVAVSVRKGSLRVSPHFFNSRDDLQRLSDALEA